MRLVVTRSGNSDLTANVTLVTVPGSANGRPQLQCCKLWSSVLSPISTAESDYTSVMRTLVFRAGVDRLTVDVPITDDLAAEATETFAASLISEAANIMVDTGRSEATISIIDNDQRGEYALK